MYRIFSSKSKPFNNSKIIFWVSLMISILLQKIRKYPKSSRTKSPPLKRNLSLTLSNKPWNPSPTKNPNTTLSSSIKTSKNNKKYPLRYHSENHSKNPSSTSQESSKKLLLISQLKMKLKLNNFSRKSNPKSPLILLKQSKKVDPCLKPHLTQLRVKICTADS